MRILLIDPPQGSVFQPYPALPCLKAFLQTHISGVQVKTLDASIACNEAMLTPDELLQAIAIIRHRLRARARDESLSAAVKMKLGLWGRRALALAGAVVQSIEDAKAILRDPHRFYEIGEYRQAMSILRGAYQILSARFCPFEIEPTGLGGRLDFCSSEELNKFILAHPHNPFREYFERALIPNSLAWAPDLVGISISFPAQVAGGFTLGCLLKQHIPQVPIVLGGAFLSTKRDWLCSNRWLLKEVADYAILGEGELPLKNLVEALREGESPNGIPGLYPSQDTPENIPMNGVVLPGEDLPIPDFSDLNPGAYLSPQVMGPLPIARGCYWQQCRFCTVSEAVSARYREMPPLRVIDAIKQASAHLHTDQFCFAVNCIRPSTMLRIAALIQEHGLRVHWSAEARQERDLTPEALRLLSAGGCDMLLFGLESASPRLRRIIRKGVAMEVARQTIHDAAQAGIAILLHLIIGFPGESMAELAQTEAFVRESVTAVSLCEISPFILEENSLVWRYASQFGVTKHWRSRPSIFHEMERYRLSEGLSMKESYLQWRRLLGELGEILYGPGQTDSQLTRDSVHAQLYRRRLGPFFLRRVPSPSPANQPKAAARATAKCLVFQHQAHLAFLVSKESRDAIEIRLAQARQARRAT